MRNKTFWAVMILVNVIVGVISVRAYQNMEAKISALSGILGIDGKYDFNNNLIKERDLSKFLSYDISLKTEVVLGLPEELEKLNLKFPDTRKIIAKAPAIVIGHYVLAASHVSDSKYFSHQTVRVRTPEGVLEGDFDFKILKHNTVLFSGGKELSLEEIYRNRNEDISLFEINKSDGISGFPFEVGNSDELRVGHFLYMNGRPEGISSSIARSGSVTSLNSGKNYNELTISQSTDRGDSGAPVLAFRDGKPELIGIYLGWIYRDENDNSPNVRSRAIKINVAVDKIKEKLGIDLRELQREYLKH